jgi:hypothetical protein
MAAKKKAKKQKKRVTREDPVRAHAKRRAAMEVSLESVKEALDRYADLGHEPGAHLLATSMEEWRSAVDRELEGMRLTQNYHAALMEMFRTQAEYGIGIALDGVSSISKAIPVMLKLSGFAFEEIEALKIDVFKNKERKAHKKKWLPDLERLARIVNIMRAFAVLFGHVEHDALELIDRK